MLMTIETYHGGPMATTPGSRLAQLREEQGLSQNQFSKLVGVTHTYVRMVELGERALSKPETIARYAAVLEVDEDVIYSILGRIPSDIVDALTSGDPGVFKKVRAALT